jgi:hypothetical protein
VAHPQDHLLDAVVHRQARLQIVVAHRQAQLQDLDLQLPRHHQHQHQHHHQKSPQLISSLRNWASNSILQEGTMDQVHLFRPARLIFL